MLYFNQRLVYGCCLTPIHECECEPVWRRPQAPPQRAQNGPH